MFFETQKYIIPFRQVSYVIKEYDGSYTNNDPITGIKHFQYNYNKLIGITIMFDHGNYITIQDIVVASNFLTKYKAYIDGE